MGKRRNVYSAFLRNASLMLTDCRSFPGVSVSECYLKITVYLLWLFYHLTLGKPFFNSSILNLRCTKGRLQTALLLKQKNSVICFTCSGCAFIFEFSVTFLCLLLFYVFLCSPELNPVSVLFKAGFHLSSRRLTCVLSWTNPCVLHGLFLILDFYFFGIC